MPVAVLDAGARLSGGLSWLYGLQEGSGSAVAGDVSGGGGRPRLTLTQVGEGGTAEFGASGIMPEGTACLFTPASVDNGLTLGSDAVTAFLGASWSLWAQFAWSGSNGARLLQLGTAPGGRVVVKATPTAVSAFVISPTGTVALMSKTVATGDNRPHWLCVTSSDAGTVSLHVDQLAAASVGRPASMGTASGLTIGGTFALQETTPADPHQVAWVGFSTAALTPERAADLGGLASGASERSDLRVARILRWLGLSTDLDAETGMSSVAYQACGGAQALDLINDVNDVEGGVFFPRGDGRLVFHSRRHRYNRPASGQLLAADVDPSSFAVSVDAAKVINEVVASRPRGATVRVRNDASFAAYPRSVSLTLYAASDDDLLAAAQWRVGRYGSPYPRVEEVVLNLTTRDAGLASMVLGLEIGDRITVTGLPDQTPGGASLDLFVEGVEGRIAHDTWVVTLSTSPGRFGYAGQLDSAEYGTLDRSAVLVY